MKTEKICCGVLEEMDIKWMAFEDGTKVMPFIESKDGIEKYRVNNCPSCGVYVRECKIIPTKNLINNK